MSLSMVMKKIPEHFDDLIKTALPPLQWIEPSAIPQPQRFLLVHTGDMTGKLERFYSEDIHLDTIEAEVEDDSIYRLVLLKTESEQIVEFGVIRIYLDVFDEETKAVVLGCRQPLGGILNEREMEYSSQLQGFVSVESNEPFNQYLGLECSQRLYGRKNRLITSDGRTIADVVEILPPS